MMLQPPSIESGLKKGILKKSVCDTRELQQYLEIARACLADSQVSGLSVHTAYVLAHEGIHNVSMAYMVCFAVRPAHKTAAVGCVLDDTNATPGQRKTVFASFDRLDNSTYKSALPPVTNAMAHALAKELERLLAGATTLIGLNNLPGGSPP